MRFYIFLFFVLLCAACRSKTDSPATAPRLAAVPADSTDTTENFFPVTDYLKGRVAEMKRSGNTPLYKITEGNRVDSFWLRDHAKFDAAFSEFLTPEIDSVSLKKKFSQNKFMDQTINAITFTYDPIAGKPDSFAFRHWDVYLDPANYNVTRVYLLKQLADGRMLQMTWQSGKWCKIVTLKTTGNNTAIEKEEKISWSYDQE